jgi:hypothetical protein
MSIVFGWNSFKIKSFTNRELNLPDQDNKPWRIEARQSYFHLFWIPFFGLGKKWVTPIGTQLYKLPPELELQIHRQNIPLPTKWYTFSLPILIAAGLSGYWAIDKINESNDRANSQARYEKVLNALDSSVQKLTTKHVLKLRDVSGNFADRYIYLKVESIKGDSVTGAFINTGKSTYEESAMNVEQFYNQYKDRLNQFSFSKQQLTASITRKYNEVYGLHRPGIALLSGDTTKYALEEADAYFGPIIKDRGTGGFGGNSLSMEFINNGWPAQVTSLKTINGDLQWNTKTPVDFPSTIRRDYPSLYLSATNYKYNTPYTFVMELTDTSGTKHEYLVEGVNLQKKITKTK